MNPLVSVLIPVYNREKIISESINCAVNQTYQNIEIIIGDNCSTDNTWVILQEWAQKDARIKIFRNEKNVGPVLNWKECMDRATGEYVKILWSDDLISDTFIEHTLPLFDEDTAFILTGVRFFQSHINNTLQVSSYQKTPEYDTNDFLFNILILNKKGFFLSPGCALFRLNDLKFSYTDDIPNQRNLDFKKTGAGNDLLFFLITANRYKIVKTVNQIESFFRIHSDSITLSNESITFYYAWARYHFITQHHLPILKEYKAKLFIMKFFSKEYDILYNFIKAPLHIPTALSLSFNLIVMRIKEKILL
jgi:glycosyltransferase involved in cell wall biosynthesis